MAVPRFYMDAAVMCEPTRDFDKDTTKQKAPRMTSDDSSFAHNSGSNSTKPVLTSHFLTFKDEHPNDCLVSRPQILNLPDISVVDLPQLVAAVSTELTTADSLWTDTPDLMPSALTSDSSLRVIKHPQKVKTHFVDKNVSKQGSTAGTEIRKKSRTKYPLTAIEVFEFFSQKKHLGGLQFYHLKVSEDSTYRPYDLHVVPCSKAGPDHYIFSPTSVIHVRDGCSVGLISLAEWYREAILWKALQDIPFFKNYLLHKAFKRWHRNVCYILFQCKCKHLQSQLLIAVPQFREALFHLTSLTEKLEKMHWLPQDESQTYTFTDFQSTLLENNQQSRRSIKKFLQDCSLILTTVEETCHKTHEEIQQQLKEFQLIQSSKSLYLQQFLSKSFHEKLRQTGQVLQRLENFKILMDCRIVQTLVSLTQSELMMYLNNILRREQKNQGSLFQAELTFGVDGQLVLCPSMQLFQELLLQALPSVVDSILQVVDDCNNLPDSKVSFQQSTPNPEMTNNADVPLNTGQNLQGHFYPLSRKQLEWHLYHHSGSQEVKKQQEEIIQEALLEIQQLCKSHYWLVDAYLSASKWSIASVERIRGWPAMKYNEHIQMIQSWISKVHHVPTALATSNKLVTINCSHIQEMLEPLLKNMEKDVFNVLSEELQLCAKNLTSDLKKSMELLNLQPTGLIEFANYFSMVKGYTETVMHQKLKNLSALQKTIELNFGNLTLEEVTLIEEPFTLWNQFVSLLRSAKERVMQQLSSMINTLDNTFFSLTKQLEDLVYSATTGPYLDLNQNSVLLVTELRMKYRQLHMISAQLNELSWINQILKGKPLDLSFVIAAKQNMKARKELWELIDISTAQIQEWRLLLFSQFVPCQAQDKLIEWLYQANSIAKFIPSSDEVLQETLCVIEKFGQKLSVIVKLSSHAIKHKHWANILEEVGLPVELGQNVTMGDLMSKELWKHRNEINKICNGAKAEADMEQAFQRLQQSWEETAFTLTKFIPNVYQKKNPQTAETQQIKPPNFELTQTDSQQNSYGRGTFTIMYLESLVAQAEDSVMTLSSMLMSPHVCDFKWDVEIWLQLLQELELFGACCEKGFWRDGAFTKVLSNTEWHECFVHSLPQIKQKVRVQKWIVLDGEPCPSWFDTLSTLGNLENPFLCLSSGKKIHLSQEGIKILVETTSLREATPSALGRCSLVCISGINVWKNVWKSEIDALYREHILDQNTLQTWKFLAEDLFSSTLIFLRHKGLTSVMDKEGFKARKTSPAITNGFQEVMSFIKILRALLWDSKKRNASKQKRDYMPKPPSTELHARNLFVIAYIWGFGGQLHPRHWLQFDNFAREALFKCRYKIEVPDKGTVFEHFFDISDKMLEDATCISRFSKNSTAQRSYTPAPQYKNYSYLMDHLLEAHYPTLLLGEAGSGKTTLCKFLLQERPHLHVPVSPCLCSADLRNILERIRSQNTSLDSSDTIMGHQCLVLFVDDLHESTFGKTSGTLDTLRQCISRDKVNTSDGYHFKHFSSKAVCYLSTCRIPEEQKSVCSQISPRLSRLFTILVLPVMTADILFSIHSSQLQQWLKNFSPMPRLADMAHCIVLATFDVYLAVHRHFSSSAHSLYIVFSLHDLQKVFQGMCLFDPRTTVQIVQQRYLPSPSLLALEPDFLGAERNILTIARLWMHECLRTFDDRLSLNKDRQKLVSFLLQASEKNFCSKFKVESQILGEMPDAGCQLQSTAIADKNQHRHTTMQKDNDQSIATREESATPHKVVASEEKSNMTESKCSEELISSSFVACVKTHTVGIQPQRLLLDVSSSIHDIVFSPEFSRLHICRAQKQLNHNILYQERDLDVLIEQLNNIVKCKDAKKNYCKQAKFAVYPQRVRQLLHILRALLIPNGHVVLFSAAKKTGRKTTVRLAAYLTGYQLIEVHCGNEVKLKELLKEARRQIDMHGEHVIFMVHENTSQATRDELLLIMETWHILDEELKELRPHISAVVKNSPDQRISQVNKRYFRSKQRHVHVFLLMPHSQNNQEKATKWSSVISHHIAKALTLCCCVEIYHPWSTEALVEVASVYLKDIVDYSALVASIAQAMAAIHQSATKYATTYLKTVQPFSPQTFIELIEYFSHLCVHLNDQVKTHANRMETVLAHIKDLKDTAQGYTREACRLKVKFQRTQKELSQLQMDMDAKVTVCEETHQRCLLEERQLSLLQEQLDLAEQQAKDVLKEEAPLYQAALKAMLSLNQSDLDEVRHYRHPPDRVVILMNAICKLFDCPCNWESCKHLLGQPRFLQELQFFDHSTLSNELFEELGEIIRSPNFQTDIVCGVSSACESLCSWVRAVYQYACVKRSMAPHKAHKDCLTNCMSEIRERLHIARLHEEAAQEELEVVKQQQQLVRNTLKELSAQLHKVKIQEEVAAVTVEQLSNLSEKWNMVKKETEMNKHTIPGDALLIAAAIAYLGPFGPDIRLDLLKKWHKMCLTGKIKISPEDIRLSLFDEPQFPSDDNTPFANIPVAVELQKALSQALRKNQHHGQTVSPNYVLKLLLWGHKATWVHKWALLTDTQQHKDRHSCTMLIEYADSFLINAEGSEKDKDFDLIVSADDPEIFKKICHGAEKGLKVLVTEIESVAPREDFLSMLDRPDVTDHIFAAFNPNTKPHPEFCLFLSTALPAKSLAEEIHPLILEKVKVIDLSLSTSEVRSIILSDLTQSECSELWLKHFQLQQDKQILLNKLQIEEVSLVDYILQTSSPLLQDPEFLSYVRLCQISSLRLQEDIEKLSNEMDSHKPTINSFDCIAALATALFKALQNVESLYPFYFFPLCNFLTALRETLAQKGWLNVPCSAETEKGLVMSDILHRIVSHIFAYYRQSLFQSHAELLRLFFSVALFMHAEESSELECAVFLRGFNNIETAEYAFSPEQSALVLPSWIPTHAKPVLNLLEKIPPFHNLISSLRNSSRLWQEYFHFPSATVVGPVPCQSHSQLTTLQRAILWKTFYPEWLAAVVDDLFACQLGQNLQSAVADSLQTSSLEAFSSFLSRNKGPIIVTMPGQIENESRSIHPVYWIKHFALHHMQLEGVKVVMLSFGSKCQNDYLLSALNTAVQTGNWLVLNNCHLLDHWDSKFITQLRQWTKKDLGLNPNKGSVENQVHPHFRLWFITKGDAPLSIPAFIRMCATHLVFDSQWDLKDELCASFRHVTSTVIPAANTVDPIPRAAILHSVLMQRQKVKHLGHGKIYKWSYEDLLALTEAHVGIAKLCHDPVQALEYIAAYLIYGGHVSDLADLEAVEAVCRVCLQPQPSIRGSGPHILSEMISIKGHFDEDILKDVQNCIETTLNSNDSLLLGFSAEMKNDIVKIRSDTLRNLLQCEFSLGSIRHNDSIYLLELTDYKMAHKRLQILQTKIEQTKSQGGCRGKVSMGPICSFLQTEWENLVETVSSLLKNVYQQPQVLAASPNITSIILELETRANLLQMYQMKESNSSYCVYCLSAFANPHGFLAALIRETVQTKHSDISQVALHYQVQGAAGVKPLDGICLSGLKLHGASWDAQIGAVQDTSSPEPCPFPLLWVKAQVRNSTISCSSYSSSSNSHPMQLYNCPLYLDKDESGKDGDWSLSLENIVTYVPIRTRLEPILCKMRRVRLVSALHENKIR